MKLDPLRMNTEASSCTPMYRFTIYPHIICDDCTSKLTSSHSAFVADGDTTSAVSSTRREAPHKDV